MAIGPRQPDGHFRFTTSTYDPATRARRQHVHRYRGPQSNLQLAHARWLSSIHGPEHHPDSTITVAELFERVDAHWSATLTAATYNAYTSYARNHIIPALGGIPLASLRTTHLDDFYRSLLDRLQPSSIRAMHNAVRSAFNCAVRWEWLTKNPATNAHLPRVPRRQPVAPATDQVVTFLDWLAAHDPQLHVACEILATTGCRVGEACGLQWRHVDWTLGTVTVAQNVARGKYRPVKETKTGNVRVVAVDDHFLDVLAPWKSDPDTFIVKDKDPTGAIPASPQQLNKRIQLARKKAGTPTITGRGLRHYVATRLIAGGVDPRTVANRLGHSSPMTTLNVYSAWVPEKDRDAATYLRTLRS